MRPEDVDAEVCTEPECGSRRKARGLCDRHYKRLWRYGTTASARTSPKRYASVADAFADRTAPNGTCIQWIGPTNVEGYGRLSHGGQTFQAHRVAYESVNGRVPAGMFLDHTCHTDAAARGDCAGGPTCLHRSCVNPDHLEPVTALVNTMRSPMAPAAVNAAKTMCIHGHPFDSENTHTDKDGKRHCRACCRVRDRKRRARTAAATTKGTMT